MGQRPAHGLRSANLVIVQIRESGYRLVGRDLPFGDRTCAVLAGRCGPRDGRGHGASECERRRNEEDSGPTDFSDCARHAEEAATVLARDSRPSSSCCMSPLRHRSTTRGCWAGWDRARCTRRGGPGPRIRWAARAADVRATGVSAHGVVRSGVAVDQILSTAAGERCDLIVIGTHGRGGLSRLFLGSVADRIVRLPRVR